MRRQSVFPLPETSSFRWSTAARAVTVHRQASFASGEDIHILSGTFAEGLLHVLDSVILRSLMATTSSPAST